MPVMKFGGTSMGNAEAIRTVGRILVDHAADRPVAVVSAMSGVTDSLLGAAELARKGTRNAVEAAIAALCERHQNVAFDLVDTDGERTVWMRQQNDLLGE